MYNRIEKTALKGNYPNHRNCTISKSLNTQFSGDEALVINNKAVLVSAVSASYTIAMSVNVINDGKYIFLFFRMDIIERK